MNQACSALTTLASDVTVAMMLMKSDIMQPIERVLTSSGPEEVISVLEVFTKLAFASDTVSQKMFRRDILKSLKILCAHKIQRQAIVIFIFPHLIHVCVFWLSSVCSYSFEYKYTISG